VITFGNSVLGAGLGAGFSSGAGATATVSGLGGAGAGFTFLGVELTVLFLLGVTVAVLDGTVFLLQLFNMIPANARNTIRDFFNILMILSH